VPHRHLELVLAANGMQRIEGLGLRLTQPRDARRPWTRGGVADEAAAREIGDDFAVMETKQGAAVEWGLAVESARVSGMPETGSELESYVSNCQSG
jgi:hypothetical protein